MEALLKVTLFFLPFLLATTFVQPFLLDLLPIFGSPAFSPLQPTNAQSKKIANVQGGGGYWQLVKENSGVSAMHLIVMPNDKMVYFDSSVTGPSQMPLPKGQCRHDHNTNKLDCFAHAAEIDSRTYETRPLKTVTDTWCSSGALDTEGNLVQAGGWNDGGNAVRMLSPCEDCNFVENTRALAVQRWYGSQQVLPDGRFIVVGGRKEHNYEYLPPMGQSNTVKYELPLLHETSDDVENNLYPIVHLSTDGNLFIFANNRSILLDPRTNKVIREFPVLKGGARNYPATGLSVLLPIDLNRRRRSRGRGDKPIHVDVLICGGAPHNSGKLAEAKKRTFLPALRSCGRLTITKPEPAWKLEVMPTPRVMGSMLLLPTGGVLIIGGAKRGCAGWYTATEPNFQTLLYRPKVPRKDRFQELTPSTIPRMYHSTAALLPDASVFVAGSNPNPGYNLTVTKQIPFVTELRMEKYYPPYLDSSLDKHRPEIDKTRVPLTLKYGEIFSIEFEVDSDDEITDSSDLMVTMYPPAFSTHSVTMNQRLLILRRRSVESDGLDTYRVTVEAPPKPELAPAGYYMMFVVNRGVPSRAVWVKLMN